MKIDPSVSSSGTARVNSDRDQQKSETIKTLAAGVTDSFVEASLDKAHLFSHPSAEKLNAGAGTVSGLDVSSNTGASDSLKLNPGTALSPTGKPVEPNKNESVALTRPSYFNGKTLSPKDLQGEQDYKRDPKNLAGTEVSFAVDDLTRKHDYTARIVAELGTLFSPVIVRLCELTGKSSAELQALLNKYGVDARNLPVPPDQKVAAFVQDPAFAATSQEKILKALYGAGLS